MLDADFGLWLLLLAFFHISEGLFAYVKHGKRPSGRSFLFSAPYVLALALATAEHLLMGHCLWARSQSTGGSSLASLLVIKDYNRSLGLALCILGETIRKTSILTLGDAFTHEIAVKQRASHRLQTRGLYAVCRHPAYTGWLLWLVGTQILLRNVVCGIALPCIAWNFFRQRISFEEDHLERFFGDAYREYRAKTFSGIPGIP